MPTKKKAKAEEVVAEAPEVDDEEAVEDEDLDVDIDDAAVLEDLEVDAIEDDDDDDVIADIETRTRRTSRPTRS